MGSISENELISESLRDEGITVTFSQDGTMFQSKEMMEKLCKVHPNKWDELDSGNFLSDIKFNGTISLGHDTDPDTCELLSKFVSFTGDKDLLVSLQMCLAKSISNHYKLRDGESHESHGARQLRMLIYQSILGKMANKSLFSCNPHLKTTLTSNEGIHFLVTSTEKLNEVKRVYSTIGHHLDFPTSFGEDEDEEDVLKRFFGINIKKELQGFSKYLKAPATIFLDREDSHHIEVYPNMIHEALVDFGADLVEWLKKKTVKALHDDGFRGANNKNVEIQSIYGKGAVSAPLDTKPQVTCTLGVMEALSTVLFFAVYKKIFSIMVRNVIKKSDIKGDAQVKKAAENLAKMVSNGHEDFLIANADGTVTDRFGVTGDPSVVIVRT